LQALGGAVYLWIVIALAATTLLAAGLLVSNLDLAEVLVAVLLDRDFFSIAMVVSPNLIWLLYALP